MLRSLTLENKRNLSILSRNLRNLNELNPPPMLTNIKAINSDFDVGLSQKYVDTKSFGNENIANLRPKQINSEANVYYENSTIDDKPFKAVFKDALAIKKKNDYIGIGSITSIVNRNEGKGHVSLDTRSPYSNEQMEMKFISKDLPPFNMELYELHKPRSSPFEMGNR